eukprot:1005028_1
METYSIHVTQRSIGAGFIEECNTDRSNECQQVVVSEVLRNSTAQTLGVSRGDILIAINGVSVNNVETYFYQRLPFDITFQKAPEIIRLIEHIKTQSENIGLEKGAIPMFDSFKTLPALIQPQISIHNHIHMENSSFKFKIYNTENIMHLTSSNGFENTTGCQQWSIKILESDICRQAIGIISNPNIDSLRTYELSARALYVHEADSNTVCYESYNNNGKQRCYKDLSNNKENYGWNEGDIIRVFLDLERWKIKFYLNG